MNFSLDCQSFHQRSFKTLATKPIDKHFWRYNDRSCSIPSRMISNVAKDQSEALKEKEEAGAVPSEVSGDEKAEIESLIASLAEKEVEIEEKKAEVEKLKDGLLRSYAEMENLRERTRREVDSSKKFAVQVGKMLLNNKKAILSPLLKLDIELCSGVPFLPFEFISFHQCQFAFVQFFSRALQKIFWM